MQQLILIDYELSGKASASWELGNVISENGFDGNDEIIKRLVKQYWLRNENNVANLSSLIARAKAWSIISKITWLISGSFVRSFTQFVLEDNSLLFTFTIFELSYCLIVSNVSNEKIEKLKR